MSGTFFGNEDDTRTKLYGYTVQKDPFLLAFEHTDHESRLTPYRALRATADYRQPLSDEIDLIAGVSYSETDRPATETQTHYSEKSKGIQFNVRKIFPADKLSIFLVGSYTMKTFTGAKSDTYMFNPGLQWHVGKLDVTATITKTYAATTGIRGKEVNEEDYYFLTVSRRIY